MKICSSCKVDKKDDEFDKRKNNMLLSWCKQCVRNKSKENYQNHKEYYKTKHKNN